MVSSARRAVASVLLIFGAVVSSSSQTTPEKDATGVISGKVTLKNKGVAGVVVLAEEQNPKNWTRSSHRGTTDQNGSYRITNLPAGAYVINPIAPSLAHDDERPNNTVVVSEGETIDDINFSLVRGGVITGNITDADGKPLIEEPVSVLPTNDSPYIDGRFLNTFKTDDRGIYRVFGLHKGKYKVSVGQDDSLPRSPRPAYRQTFYPSVTDDAKATVIEVTEGSEAANVDIVVGRPVTMFKVTGRILEAETGKPVPNVKYGVYQQRENGGSTTVGQNVTSANGEFRLENVLPGHYVVFIVPENSSVRGDSVSFEVVDRDVADLVINAAKGASVSGVIVFEGAEGSAATIKPNELFVNAWTEDARPYFGGSRPQAVNPDGSFKFGGLQKGRIRFNFMQMRNQLELVRVERDGLTQGNGLIVKDGEQVTGLRLVVKYLTGAIHGQVKVEGDEPIPNAQLSVWINALDGNRSRYQFRSGPTPQLDSRKRFAIEGLAAGTYEVNVAVFDPGRQDSSRIYREQVTVVDNAVSEVTITIKTKP
jgi:carboxypeptidase family protein